MQAQRFHTSSDNNLALKGFSILPNHLRKAHLRKYWWFCPISVSNAHTHDSIMFPLYQICRQEVSCVCVGTCGGWQPLLGSSEAPVSMTITTLPSFVYIKVRATSSEAHERRTGKKKDKTVFLPMPRSTFQCAFSPPYCVFFALFISFWRKMWPCQVRIKFYSTRICVFYGGSRTQMWGTNSLQIGSEGIYL